MLESYTWGDFFTFLLIGLCLYYLFVAFFYYGEDLNKLISGKKQIINPSATVALSGNSIKEKTFSPIIAESINTQSFDIEEHDNEDVVEEISENATNNTNSLARDTYDWENTQVINMDYKDATPEEEILLDDIDVSEPDSDEDMEGGIPADDYADTIIEIQKENIEVEKEEVTKAVLRRSYFNASMVDLYKTNEKAKANIDAMLTGLMQEKEISLSEIATFSDYVNNDTNDEDVQALMNILNNN